MQPDLILRGRIPSKKNNRNICMRGSKIVNTPNERYRSWHVDASMQVFTQIGRKNFPTANEVEIVFWMPDNIRKDLTNAAESVMDLLIDCGTIDDDCWQKIQRVLLHCEGIDRENPRCEIWIR